MEYSTLLAFKGRNFPTNFQNYQQWNSKNKDNWKKFSLVSAVCGRQTDTSYPYQFWQYVALIDTYYCYWHTKPWLNLIIARPLFKYILWNIFGWKITEINHMNCPATVVEDRRLLIIYHFFIYASRIVLFKLLQYSPSATLKIAFHDAKSRNQVIHNSLKIPKLVPCIWSHDFYSYYSRLVFADRSYTLQNISSSYEWCKRAWHLLLDALPRHRHVD